MTDPIVKKLTVPLDPQRAFTLFTAEMAEWWPLDTHSLSAAEGTPADSVTITPEPGGAVFETRPDGTTAPWGRVTDWRPGKAFGMTWHVGRPEDQASHVQVTFDVVAEGTQVTLIHDNWQVLGEVAVAQHASYLTGWDKVLGGCYSRACAAQLQTA